MACADPSTLSLRLPLDGTPTGMALTPDDQLAVVQRDPLGTHTLSVFDRGSGVLQWGHPAGAGRPVVGDGRIYTLTPTGAQAFRERAIDWDHDTGAQVPNDSGMALTQEGVVVFGTQRGAVGTLHGVTHLGFPLWTAELDGVPRGSPVVDDANQVYAWAFSADGSALHAFDGADGTLLWSREGELEPLMALEDGLLVRTGGEVQRIDGSGVLAWSTASDATTATRSDASVWLPNSSGTLRVALDTGESAGILPVTCGPITLDLLSSGWSMCNDAGSTGVQLTSLSNTPVGQGLQITDAIPVGAPILLTGNAYVLVDGPAPAVLGFPSTAAPGTGAWSSAHGSSSNDRRIQP